MGAVRTGTYVAGEEAEEIHGVGDHGTLVRSA